jgi:hypothetical protein
MRLRIHAEIDALVTAWRQHAAGLREESVDWDESRGNLLGAFQKVTNRGRADELEYRASELENLNWRIEEGKWPTTPS